jgi:hypothetical protein
MDFTSQICTTKEQSERLLDLGLKTETADMAYEYKPKHLADTDLDKDWVLVAHSPCGADIPAWSLHRLIEIYKKTCIFWTDCLDNPYEAMISRIADKIKWGELNKEYLEE